MCLLEVTYFCGCDSSNTHNMLFYSLCSLCFNGYSLITKTQAMILWTAAILPTQTEFCTEDYVLRGISLVPISCYSLHHSFYQLISKSSWSLGLFSMPSWPLWTILHLLLVNVTLLHVLLAPLNCSAPPPGPCNSSPHPPSSSELICTSS